jgi:ATP-dependent DNA ligase
MTQEAMVDEPPSGEPRTLTEVDQVFDAIVTDHGLGSTERKIRTLRRLFRQVGPKERQFLAQLVMGELRHGDVARGLPRLTIQSNCS